MSKALLGVFLGVFVGALGYELVTRNNPGAIQKIRDKVRNMVDEIFGADDMPEEFDEPLEQEA